MHSRIDLLPGERLRSIATTGDLSNRTVKVIAWRKANYTKPLDMNEFAELSPMGVSTLHHRPGALTAMSSLQYLKAASPARGERADLLAGPMTEVLAFEIGYECVRQFNREYRWLFGQPLMREIETRPELAANGPLPGIGIGKWESPSV